MDSPLSAATRDHVREYVWRTKPTLGMTQKKLAGMIGYNRKSLNEFVNGKLPKMPADVTENFYALYNKLDRSTPWLGGRGVLGEAVVEYGGAAYEAEVIALALEKLTALLRNENESDTTKFYETIHVLYGILKQIGGSINFERETAASDKSSVV